MTQYYVNVLMILLIISGSQEAQSYTLKQSKALAMTAIDIMYNPQLLDGIKKEFKQTLSTYNKD